MRLILVWDDLEPHRTLVARNCTDLRMPLERAEVTALVVKPPVALGVASVQPALGDIEGDGRLLAVDDGVTTRAETHLTRRQPRQRLFLERWLDIERKDRASLEPLPEPGVDDALPREPEACVRLSRAASGSALGQTALEGAGAIAHAGALPRPMARHGSAAIAP